MSHGKAQEALGGLYFLRFTTLSDASALQKCLAYLQAAVDDADDKHPDLPHRRHSLAAVYEYSYKDTGILNHLNLSIHWYKFAIDVCQNDNPNLPFLYRHLAEVYFMRHEHKKNRIDLKQAIKFQLSALKMISSDNLGFVKFSADLAQFYCYRFEMYGEEKDVDNGVRVLVRAVMATSSNCPGLLKAWLTLSQLLLHRFRNKGSKKDLETVIVLRKEAVQATFPGTIEHITCMQTLANAYLERYRLFESSEDLELSIKHLQEAISQAPTDKPIHAALHGDLGVALMKKHLTMGGDEIINPAVQYIEMSMKSLLAGDERIPISQKNLALAYLGRYSNTRDIVNLRQAQGLLKEALGAIQPTDPHLHEFHNALAIAYQLYFTAFGDLSYISLALDHYKLAVALISPTSIYLSQYEQSIAECYALRFGRLFDHHDLDLGIQYCTQSLERMSANHQNTSSAKSILSGLLYGKFVSYDDVADLDSAMKLQKEALKGVGESNSSLPGLVYDLVRLHLAYFKRTKDIAHLEAASPLMNVCLIFHENDLLSLGHLHRWAIMLENVYMVNGKIDRIYGCIEVCNWIINHLKTDDPIVPRLYHLLGRSFSIMCIHSQDASSDSVSQEVSAVEDAYCALYYYRASVTSPLATPALCMGAASDWAHFAKILNLNETITAYSFALATLPNISWIGNSLGDRYNSLVRSKISDLVSSSVAAALKFNDIKHAVEFMEQGLAITYRQMLELKDEPTQLIEKYPEIGLELKQISLKLQEISDPKITIKQDYHSLVKRQKDLIQKIRTFPGFESFFLPKSFKDLSKVAEYGPVVLLNASCESSDAIILLPSTCESSANPLSVLLPEVTIANLQHHCENLRRLLGFHNIFVREGDKPEKERYGKPSPLILAESSLKYFRALLSWLWKTIVKPVYDVLESVSNNFHNDQPPAKLLIEWHSFWKNVVVPFWSTHISAHSCCCCITQHVYSIIYPNPGWIGQSQDSQSYYFRFWQQLE